MTVRKPAPGELDAIETASRDEIQALQLQRLICMSFLRQSLL